MVAPPDQFFIVDLAHTDALYCVRVIADRQASMQVEPINTAFSPTAAEIAFATRVVEVFGQAKPRE